MEKKVAIVASVLSMLLMNGAMAEGQHSLGVSESVYKTQAKLNTENYYLTNTKEKSKNHVGTGVVYKYTYTFYNLDKLYIEPEIFLDITKYEDTSTRSANYIWTLEQVELFPNLGAKFNLGYHINSKHDVYLGAGAQNVTYDIEWLDLWFRSHQRIFGNETAILIGLGYNYHINDKVALGLQYNEGYCKIDGPDKLLLSSGKEDQAVYNIEYSNLKMNLSYKF